MQKRKLPVYVVMLTLLSMSGLGCNTNGSNDEGFDQFALEGTNVSISDITGSWNATKGLFGRSGEGPVVEVDVVAEGGSITLNIQTNGRFSVSVGYMGETDTSTGRFAFDEDLLVISFDDDPEEWEYFSISHGEPNLSIMGGTVYEAFDFDGDGTDEDADIDFEFTRVS